MFMNKISISDKNNKFLIEKNFFYECIEIFDRLKIRTSFFSDKKNGYIEISYRNLNDYVNECLFKIISNTIFFNNSVVYNDIKYRNDLDNEFTLLYLGRK